MSIDGSAEKHLQALVMEGMSTLHRREVDCRDSLRAGEASLFRFYFSLIAFNRRGDGGGYVAFVAHRTEDRSLAAGFVVRCRLYQRN